MQALPNTQNILNTPTGGILFYIVIGVLLFASFVLFIRYLIIRRRDKTVSPDKLALFPRKILTSAMTLTLLAVLWGGGNSTYIYSFLRNEVKNDLASSRLNQQVLYLDAIQYHALNMSITTGNAKWADQYYELDGKLAFTTRQIMEAYKTPYLQDAIQKSIQTHEKLDALETKILSEVELNNKENALALVGGQDYSDLKNQNSDALLNLTREALNASEVRLNNLANNIYTSIYLTLIGGSFLLFSWFYALRSIRKWQIELEDARTALAARILEKEQMESKLASMVQSMELAQKEIIAARKVAEHETQTTTLLKSVAATANRTSDVRIAVHTVIELVGAYIQFPIGHAYAVDLVGNALSSSRIWSLNNSTNYPAFMNKTEENMPHPQDSLVQRSWQKLSPIWTNAPSELDATLLYRKLSSEQIKTGFAFPIIVKGEAHYILEFYSPEYVPVNTHFLDILREIGNQIALVIERKHNEIALERSKNDAEAANAAKSDFLANMSHEIRTPMNGVLGMLTLALDTEMTKQQHEWVDIARQSAETLLDIINDILDISKIEAGELVIESIPFGLHTTIEAITDLLYTRARSKGLNLLVEIDPKVPRRVIGDPLRLRQVILNLIGNAMKFTEVGHVLLRVTGGTSSSAPLHFEVIDTGIGIATNKLGHIFNKFSQAQESTTRRFGGTGLGLTISKKLVNLMGGVIDVKSDMGHGSTFWFDLPLQTDLTEEEDPLPHVDVSNLRILVYEPYTASRDILNDYFTAWGMYCDTLNDSTSVITSIEKLAEAGTPYDIFLVDADAPSGKWWSIIQNLALMPVAKNLIIILTAPPGLGLQHYDLRANKIAGVINKPVYPSQLFDTIRYLWAHKRELDTLGLVTRNTLHILRKTTLDGPLPPIELSKHFPGLRILLVEDQPVNQLLMKTILEKMECTVTIAGNGVEALQLVKANVYDLILMDCQMPEMDGFETTQHIRAMERGSEQHIPIIALTADAMQGDKDRCLAIGMDDYINKPVRPQRILEVLVKFSSKRAK